MIKIFADTANIEEIKELEKNTLIKGYTCNPSIMRKAGITDYENFCKDVLSITKKPVSFEVFADEFDEMERQARIISSWSGNVYVKIPITNTKGKSSIVLINKLLSDKIKINITAVFKAHQLSGLGDTGTPHIISVFAGRIADTGFDPVPILHEVKMKSYGSAEVLWASPREVFNIYEAEMEGIDIITATPEIIKKYESFKRKDLLEFSLDTVKMFYNDGQAAGYKL